MQAEGFSEKTKGGETMTRTTKLTLALLAIAAAVTAPLAYLAFPSEPKPKRIEQRIANHVLIAGQGDLSTAYRVREIAVSYDAKIVISGGGYMVELSGRDALFLVRTAALMEIRDNEVGQ